MSNELNYSELLDMITEQVLHEKDTENKSMLRKQFKELSAMLTDIISTNIEKDNEKYKLCLENLEKANKSLNASLKDGRKVVRTIQVLSETITSLENLLS